MATYTVTTDSDAAAPDDGLLSLREALALANADPGGDQKLDWIDTDAFAGRGQVREAVVAGHTVIEVNLDQDARAELVVALDREIDLQRANFLL
jgi:hypothetical protein